MIRWLQITRMPRTRLTNWDPLTMDPEVIPELITSSHEEFLETGGSGAPRVADITRKR